MCSSPVLNFCAQAILLLQPPKQLGLWVCPFRLAYIPVTFIVVMVVVCMFLILLCSTGNHRQRVTCPKLALDPEPHIKALFFETRSCHSLGWPQTHDLPVPAFWLLSLYACVNTMDSDFREVEDRVWVYLIQLWLSLIHLSSLYSRQYK